MDYPIRLAYLARSSILEELASRSSVGVNCELRIASGFYGLHLLICTSVERRPRSPDEAIMREWRGSHRSPSPIRRRIPPERDEWQRHEDISISRRPRSLEREDAFASEWDDPPPRGWQDRHKSPLPIRRRPPKRDEWQVHEDISISRRPRSLEREVDGFASEWDDAPRREWRERRKPPPPTGDKWQAHEDISITRGPRSFEPEPDAFASEWEGPPRREWQDRRSSPLPVRRRMSPKRDEWETHEDISISRRPRIPEPATDALTSKWDDPRRSRNAFELEEDAYHQRRVEPRLSNDSPVDDWAFVDAPPRSARMMDRKVVERRYSRERGPRPPAGDGMLPESEADARGGPVGRRYVGTKSRKERLWTEITKDLVLREAIERAGYEFEETEFFYYIYAYLRYVSWYSVIVSGLTTSIGGCVRARRPLR